jgi:hypothetical protein
LVGSDERTHLLADELCVVRKLKLYRGLGRLREEHKVGINVESATWLFESNDIQF